MDASESRGLKRIWSREETIAFLQAYSARKEEFLDVRKKKYAMGNILEDLTSQGVLTQPTSVQALQNKLKNLLRAWKASKDNSNRTGSSPCFAPYESLMEEIFGDRPIISNPHTLNLHGDPIQALEAPEVVEDDRRIENQDVACLPSTSRGGSTRRGKTRISVKEKYYERKLQLKKEFSERRIQLQESYQNRKLEKLEENEKARQRRHDGKMSILRQLME